MMVYYGRYMIYIYSYNSITRSILDGLKLILTSLLVSMGFSALTSSDLFFFCRVSFRLAMINKAGFLLVG